MVVYCMWFWAVLMPIFCHEWMNEWMNEVDHENDDISDFTVEIFNDYITVARKELLQKGTISPTADRDTAGVAVVTLTRVFKQLYDVGGCHWWYWCKCWWWRFWMIICAIWFLEPEYCKTCSCDSKSQIEWSSWRACSCEFDQSQVFLFVLIILTILLPSSTTISPPSPTTQ